MGSVLGGNAAASSIRPTQNPSKLTELSWAERGGGVGDTGSTLLDGQYEIGSRGLKSLQSGQDAVDMRRRLKNGFQPPQERLVRIRRLLAAATGLIIGATGIIVAVPSAGSAVVAPQPRRILSGWLPYWTPTTSTNATVANADLFSDASPFWHSATSATAISYQLDATSRASVVGRLHAAGIPVIPSVTDGTSAHTMAAILANPTTRAQHVAALVSLVLVNGYDGIDLDYEKFAFSDGSTTWPTTRPNWVAFVRDLSAALHSHGKKLTVAVPVMYDATYSHTSGYWVYDYKGIGPYVDSLRIMAYDYSFSVAGPIAPLSWVHRVAAFAATQLPASKIRIGVPTYGYDWPSSTTGCPVDNLPRKTGYTAAQAATLAASLSVTPTWNATYGERSFSYRKTYAGHNSAGAAASCTVTRTVWYDDASAVKLRAAFVSEFQLGGIALWTIGGEDAHQWSALRTFALSIAPTRTQLTGGPAATTVLFGHPVLVRGLLRRLDGTGIGAATVSLQALPRGSSAWKTIGSAVTSSTGSASLSVSPTATTAYRWYFAGDFATAASVGLASTVSVEIPAVLVHTTPGYHTVAGREWYTTCAPYLTSTRCFSYIKANTVVRVGNSYQVRTAFVFNNITYSGSAAAWAGNRLARTGSFVSGGHSWRVTCTPDATVGARSCRAYVWVHVTGRKLSSSGGFVYAQWWEWVFNDVVVLTA